MLRMLSGGLREKAEQLTTLSVAMAFALAGLMPLILSGQASAGTLSSRKVTLSTSQAATSANYEFRFTPTVGTAEIESIILQFCNTPLGDCVLPGETVAGTNNGTDDNTELDVTTSVLPGSHFDGTNDDGFAKVTADTGQCTDADLASQIATMVCLQRTQAGNEAAAEKVLTVNSILNPTIPSGNSQQVYVRITTYSDNAFASNTAVDNGTVAAAIVNQLTVTGRVQERLVFCVFALADDDATATQVGPADAEFPTNCASDSANEGSNVDIGVIDNLGIARSPVDNAPPATLGNDRIGAAMVNTNASLGVNIAYYATADTGGTEETRAFRVDNATCAAGQPATPVFTDQCFRSAADNTNAGTTITAGVENFGMQIVCVSNSGSQSTNTEASAGADRATTSNLGAGDAGTGATNTFRTAYANGDANLAAIQDAASDDCENTEAGNLFAWNDSATAQPIIGSSTVVDDELVKLRFGASANATTPTGTYTVASTFIATATF